MGLSTKNIFSARRLSVFILFVGVFSIFFGLFYYKFLPDNQAELNTRGFRILGQFSQNIARRNSIMEEIFGNLSLSKGNAMIVSGRISQQIPFDTGKKVLSVGMSFPDIQRYKDTDWSLSYPIRLERGRSDSVGTVTVRFKDFMDPVLSARDDLFDDYLILQRDSARQDQRNMKILYKGNLQMSSASLNADSALSLQKNSDLSSLSNVVIGGVTYTMFYQPFSLGKANLALAGLVDKDTYSKKIRTLPLGFVVCIIMVIIIGLIALPFLKILLLSPKENVFRTDVVALVMSIYLGSAILVLAGVFFLANYSARTRVTLTLESLSDKLETELVRNVDSVGRQLDEYTALYAGMDPSLKRVLSYRNNDPRSVATVDSIFGSRAGGNIARVFWIDSAGNTMAKWNTFNFISPLAPVTRYSFYTRLKNKSINDTCSILDAIKSNITGEFQLVVARRQRMPVYHPPDSVHHQTNEVDPSFGMMIAFNPNSSLRAVLPEGFGFALVDNESMNVLMHSDFRRNLAENLYVEANRNERLRHSIRYRQEGAIDDVDLYGTPQIVYVEPILGQNVSLVLFYDTKSYSVNIYRMVHFGGETLLYVALALAFCILISVLIPSHPGKLSFNIDAVDWVRPLDKNERSYEFTTLFFTILLFLWLFFFFLASSCKVDVRSIFYISLLLPFYAVWGFFSSRRGETILLAARSIGSRKVPEGLLGALRPFLSSLPTVFVLVLLNLVVFKLMQLGQVRSDPWIIAVVLLFQAAAFTSQVLCYRLIYADNRRVRRKQQATNENFLARYVRSLCLSIIVISILPMTGIMFYSWRVEKIQYARRNLLGIADRNIGRMKFFSVEYLPGLKPQVLGYLNKASNYSDTMLASGGLYLDEPKRIYMGGADTLNTDPNDATEPYISMLDNLYPITNGEFNNYSIQKEASDGSWKFFDRCADKFQDNVRLYRRLKFDPTCGLCLNSDPLMKDFVVSSGLHTSMMTLFDMSVFQWALLLLLIILFLFLLPRMLKICVNRLFLLHFVKDETLIDKKANVLAPYFRNTVMPDPDCFNDREGRPLPLSKRSEYILAEMIRNKSVYEEIWQSLPQEERYILYDFARDGYTNYKEAKVLFILLNKGLLLWHNNELKIFSISFREFLAEKRNTTEIASLKEKYAVPGLWATIRIPSLILISACGILLLVTQENISHQVTVLIPSIGAIVPVLLSLTKKAATKGNG